MNDRLFDHPPVVTLTARQERGLAAIRAAGWDGIATEALGAVVHAHPPGPTRTCEFCVSAGSEVGKALRRKGLVCQRRRDGRLVWTLAGKLARTDEGVIPF